jgi:N-acetylglucosamine-6-phosphate deacetylase
MAIEAIRAGRALTPREEIADAVILIEDGRIAAVGRRQDVTLPRGAKEYDARAHTVVPGFIDIHVHGAGGRDVMDGSPEALQTIASVLARHGTTSLLATTVSAPADRTCGSVAAIARYIANPSPSGRAEILGIHFEGPFINASRRGVHPAESLATPSVQSLNALLAAANGQARILTLAPELPGALEVIDAAQAAGLIVALGHTDATYAEACAGFQHGIRHAVHVFNAMRPFSHRETGALGAVLTDVEITAEIIADGVHVDDPAIRLLLAAKGPDRVLLVSDGTAATAMPDGSYRLGTFAFTVSGGVCRNSEGKLAGSTLTLDRAVRHMVRLGVPLARAVQMATLNPARRLGIESTKGLLAVGADADLVWLNDRLEVAAVMIHGKPLE